jgi:hypothetical protein
LFERDGPGGPPALTVTPFSGQQVTISDDLIEVLASHHDVEVADWVRCPAELRSGWRSKELKADPPASDSARAHSGSASFRFQAASGSVRAEA